MVQGTKIRRVVRLLHSDVSKIFVYIVASLLLGALLAPWIYNLGMGIAEVTSGKETNWLLKEVGEAAMRSKDNFPRFFARSLQFSALLLLGPLISWIRVSGRSGKFRDTPWSLRLPDSVVAMDQGQPLQRRPSGWRQCFWGFVLAGGVLLISGWVLIQAGVFMWRDAATSTQGVASPWIETINWMEIMTRAAKQAIGTSLLEEVLFRGILLGIFLRAMRPAFAIGSLSFLFAFVHFLSPPVGSKVPDPEAMDAGFILLGYIAERFASFHTMLAEFSVIVAVGVVLAVARYRTASLWLPIGLHAGWVFCLSMFKAATWPVGGSSAFDRLMIGTTLKEGLMPFAMVVITGMVMAYLTRSRNEAERA